MKNEKTPGIFFVYAVPHCVPVVPLEKPSEGTHRGREIFELKIFLYFQRQRGRFDSGFGTI
jgi:hypothetical protein